MAPIVLAIQGVIRWLPNVIYAVGTLLAVLLALSLPDTTNINMMESIEEAENFYVGKTEENTSFDESSLR